MSEKIAISAETTIDLPKEDLEKYNIHVLPFHVLMGEKEGYDNEFTNEDLFQYTKKTGKLCRTSACNVEELEKHFAALFEEGYTQIIHFSISDKLSSGYKNAVQAAHGNPNIVVIDTHVASSGIFLLVRVAYEALEKGLSLLEIEKNVLEARDKNLQTSLIVSSLDFLYRGGRCSKLAALGANLLKIKPAVVCDENGSLQMKKKFRGNVDRCVRFYVDWLLETYPNIDKRFGYLDYTVMDPKILEETKRYLLEEKGFQEIGVYRVSATIGVHTGPDAMGFQFLYNVNK